MFRIPSATYRVQFNADFRFRDARELVPYLDELGISDLYASPRFKARQGSSHGYDVADPFRVNPELGTEREFEELAGELRRHLMGLLLDIVPNHMAASHENPWWTDVLENGPSSPYAEYFDIDWHPPVAKASFLEDNRVLLPILGDLYGNVLENCEVVLRADAGGFFIEYYDHRFPLEPKSCAPLLEGIARQFEESSEIHREVHAALSQILDEVRGMPPYPSSSAEDRELRASRSRRVKEQLGRLYRSTPEVPQAVDRVLRQINGSRRMPASLIPLDQILSEQPYRLGYWKIGLEEINYRRFFDVNDLVGLRVEVPRVFADRHRAILQLIREGTVTGLRVDHIDGLYDPLAYLRRLQASAMPEEPHGPPQAIYVVVEKILGEREALPLHWPVAGTTGYDFLNSVNAIFIDRKGLSALERAYARRVEAKAPFAEVSYKGNKLVMQLLFAGEVQSLTRQLGQLAARHRRARDLPMKELTRALEEVTACLPIYRTYIDGYPVSQRDRDFLARALSLARKRVSGRAASEAAFSFLRQVLFLDPPHYATEIRDEYLRFVTRWQQFTGPVMAKGLEDTAFYIHNSLISLNEVGGDPAREFLPLAVREFHESNGYRQLHWPHSLNATSTHDTKRGEDVRARINVLSELSREWNARFERWHGWNARFHRRMGARSSPEIEEESLLYQTMLGAWPHEAEGVAAFRERLQGFMVKAAREAKARSGWIDPSQEHEAALVEFVDRILATDRPNPFLADFLKFKDKIAFYGFLNSLSQALLKIASPGVPDFYQGSELWDYNLVDPDNRRPVDFGLRAKILEEIKGRDAADRNGLLKGLLTDWQDGRIKLFLTWKALSFRRRHVEIFEQGDYLPCDPSGKLRGHLCVFARRDHAHWVLVAVPRFLSRLVKPGRVPVGRGVWGSLALRLPVDAPLEWHNEFTGERLRAIPSRRQRTLPVADLLRTFPVALCSSIPSGA